MSELYETSDAFTPLGDGHDTVDTTGIDDTSGENLIAVYDDPTEDAAMLSDEKSSELHPYEPDPDNVYDTLTVEEMVEREHHVVLTREKFVELAQEVGGNHNKPGSLFNVLVRGNDLSHLGQGRLEPADRLSYFVENKEGQGEWLVSMPNLEQHLDDIHRLRHSGPVLQDLAAEMIAVYEAAVDAKVLGEVPED